MIVLDTNVVSESFRPRPSLQVMSWLDGLREAELWICTPVLAELRYGAEILAPGKAKHHLVAAIDGLEAQFTGRILPLDAAAAIHYARLSAKRERAGRRIEQMDVLIAAIALANGAALATRNTRDFADLDLDLVNPFDLDVR